MNIPYSKFELETALFLMKEIDENEIERILEELVPKDKKEYNKRIAESNGIDVETLVNSPNYEVLFKQYMYELVLKIKNELSEKLGITDKESWAIIALGVGLLNPD